MNYANLRISAEELAGGRLVWEAPLAIVDLDREEGDPGVGELPGCPVIGVGSRLHPLAGRLDTVVAKPSELGTLVSAIVAQQSAATICTQLLRLLPALGTDDSLTAESMAYAVLQGSEPHREWIARQVPRSGALPEGRAVMKRCGAVLTVTLDRADAGNAIDRSMRDALHEAFAMARIDDSIDEVRLAARGKAFSLGADLTEFGTTTDPATAHRIRSLTLPARQAAFCAQKLTAHIDGACVGAGLELAAFARRITATPRSWFQLPELAMGIIPGAGGCVSLSRRIGRQRALQMILSGKRISARRALEWGLVDAVVDEAA